RPGIRSRRVSKSGRNRQVSRGCFQFETAERNGPLIRLCNERPVCKGYDFRLKTSSSEEGVYAMAKPTKLGFLRTVSRHPLYMEHLILNKFKSLPRYKWAERHPERDDDVGPPLGYKLVLTYKCNLRCIMCYEWGEVGWCHDEPKQAIAQELDWAIVQ